MSSDLERALKWKKEQASKGSDLERALAWKAQQKPATSQATKSNAVTPAASASGTAYLNANRYIPPVVSAAQNIVKPKPITIQQTTIQQANGRGEPKTETTVKGPKDKIIGALINVAVGPVIGGAINYARKVNQQPETAPIMAIPADARADNSKLSGVLAQERVARREIEENKPTPLNQFVPIVGAAIESFVNNPYASLKRENEVGGIDLNQPGARAVAEGVSQGRQEINRRAVEAGAMPGIQVSDKGKYSYEPPRGSPLPVVGITPEDWAKEYNYNIGGWGAGVANALTLGTFNAPTSDTDPSSPQAQTLGHELGNLAVMVGTGNLAKGLVGGIENASMRATVEGVVSANLFNAEFVIAKGIQEKRSPEEIISALLDTAPLATMAGLGGGAIKNATAGYSPGARAALAPPIAGAQIGAYSALPAVGYGDSPEQILEAGASGIPMGLAFGAMGIPEALKTPARPLPRPFEGVQAPPRPVPAPEVATPLAPVARPKAKPPLAKSATVAPDLTPPAKSAGKGKGGEVAVIRPKGWEAQNDVPATWTRKGHVYRGMTAAEYDATIGAGKGVQSRRDYSLAGEGTSFSDKANDAEAYVNFGRDDPRKTGKPNYLIEVSISDDLVKDTDGYFKAQKEITPDRITRVVRMSAVNGEIVAEDVAQVKPKAKAQPAPVAPAKSAEATAATFSVGDSVYNSKSKIYGNIAKRPNGELFVQTMNASRTAKGAAWALSEDWKSADSKPAPTVPRKNAAVAKEAKKRVEAETQPVTGTLAAIDSNTGKQLWQLTREEYEVSQAGKNAVNYPYETIQKMAREAGLIKDDLKPSGIESRLSEEGKAALERLRAQKLTRGAVGNLPKGEGASEQLTQRLKDVATIGRDLVKAGVNDFDTWAREMKDIFTDWVEEHLPKIWAEVNPQGEKKAESPTGLYYRKINEERAEQGLPSIERPETKAHQETMDEALAIQEKNPDAGRLVVDELLDNPRGWKNDTETALAIIHKVDTQRSLRAIRRELSEAEQKGNQDDIKAAKSKADVLEARLAAIDTVMAVRGGASTLSGRAISMLATDVYPDYSMENLTGQLRQDQGGKPLSQKQHDLVERTEKQFNEANEGLERIADVTEEAANRTLEQLREAKERIGKLEAELKRAKQEPSVKARETNPRAPKFGEQNKIYTRDRYEAAKERVLAKTRRMSANVDPTVIADLSEMVGYYIEGMGRSTYAAVRQALRNDVPGISESDIRRAYDLVTNEKALAAHTKRLARDSAMWRERIEKGDFEKPITRRELQLTPEVEKAQFQLDEVKRQWNEERMRLKWQNMKWPAKVGTVVLKTIGTFKDILTADVASALGRQAGWGTAAHPLLAARQLPGTFRAIRNRETQHRVMNEIINDADYLTFKRWGLELTDITGRDITRQEEIFQQSYAPNIPIIGHSQRSFVTLLNLMRYRHLKLLVQSHGGADNISLGDGKAWADQINVAYARGNVGKLKNLSAAVAPLTFAGPRYYASRVQLAYRMFTLGQARGGISPMARKVIATEYVRAWVGLAAYNALLLALGAQYKDELLSSDFGKAIFNHTRVDTWLGMQQYVVYVGRMLMGKSADTKGHKPYPQNQVKTTLNLIRSKAGPLPGTVVDLGLGSSITGEKVPKDIPGKIGYAAKRNLIPITAQDFMPVLRDVGIPLGTFLNILNQGGTSVNTFTDKPKYRN